MATLQADALNFSYPDHDQKIITNFSHSFAPTLTTGLLGVNGCGKSTLMALLAGVFQPSAGTLYINKKASNLFETEEQLNEEVTFLFQNMEFETEEKTGLLLEMVAQQNKHDQQPTIESLCKTFAIQSILETPINKISKGELQKTLLCFTLLSKAKIVIMDEPVFALSHEDALKTLIAFKKIADQLNMMQIISLHDIDLMEKICDEVILFKKDGSFETGSAQEKLTPEKLEEVYGIPYAFLKKQEYAYSALYNQTSKQ